QTQGSAPLLPARLDHMFWTVMSYNDGYNFDANGLIQFNASGQVVPGGNPQLINGNTILTDYGYAGGPMALDIAATQYLYGANAPFHQNDDVYDLPDANQAGTKWYCIWDTGGNDTIEYSGTKNVTIDLRPATLDNTATGGGVLSYAANVRGGFTIA